MRITSAFTKNPISDSKLDVRPVGDRHAEHDVVLSGVAMEKRLESGKKRPEQRHPLPTAQLRQAGVNGEVESRSCTRLPA